MTPLQRLRHNASQRKWRTKQHRSQRAAGLCGKIGCMTPSAFYYCRKHARYHAAKALAWRNANLERARASALRWKRSESEKKRAA
jgi:hypothetical protein